MPLSEARYRARNRRALALQQPRVDIEDSRITTAVDRYADALSRWDAIGDAIDRLGAIISPATLAALSSDYEAAGRVVLDEKASVISAYRSDGTLTKRRP